MSAIAAYKTKLFVLSSLKSDADESIMFSDGGSIADASGDRNPSTQCVDYFQSITLSKKSDTMPDMPILQFLPGSSDPRWTLSPNFILTLHDPALIPAKDDPDTADDETETFTYQLQYSYANCTAIIGSNQSSMAITGDILDATDHVHAQKNDGFKNMVYGLLDATASIQSYEQDTMMSLDMGKDLMDKLLAREPVLLQREFGGITFRGLFTIESISQEGEVSSLSNQTINLQLKGGFLWLI